MNKMKKFKEHFKKFQLIEQEYNFLKINKNFSNLIGGIFFSLLVLWFGTKILNLIIPIFQKISNGLWVVISFVFILVIYTIIVEVIGIWLTNKLIENQKKYNPNWLEEAEQNYKNNFEKKKWRTYWDRKDFDKNKKNI